MSIIRYTPLQDAFIISGSVGQTLNTGLDEILQLGYCNRLNAEGPARALLDFGNIELPASTSKATLHLYLANAYNLSLPKYSVRACPISESWQEGYGKYYDERDIANIQNRVFDAEYASSTSVEDTINGSDSSWIVPTRVINSAATTEGVSWNYRTYAQDTWITAGGDMTGEQTYVTQSFTHLDSKDIDLDVTELLQTEDCSNGFIIGFNNETEAMLISSSLLFYSKDTHTIYRPYLQIEVNDAIYSSSLSTISSEQISIVPGGFKPEFNVDDNVRINLKVSPKYPARVYSTASLHSNNWILPEESYWGVRNEFTKEMVVDFCDGTKISADDTSSYFDLNASILEPGRYYRLLYQVNLGSNRKIIFDNRNIFKVVQNG